MSNINNSAEIVDSNELINKLTVKARIFQFLRQIQFKDILWTDRNLYHTPFHSGFWVKQRIEKAVISQTKRAKGIFLDVGCGMKPYEKDFLPFIEKYYGVEYSPKSGYRGNRADVAGDASEMPFANESIDTILCTEVMEHVMNPEKVMTEFARVLKPEGVIIITVPFFYPIHDAFDFFRYAHDGIAVMMKRQGLEIEEVVPLSGGGVTLAIMFNLFWFDLGFMWTKWLYPIGLLFRPLLWILLCLVNLFGWLLENLISSPQMSFNHLTVGRKPAKFE